MYLKIRQVIKNNYIIFLYLVLLNCVISLFFFIDIQRNSKELGICDTYEEYSISYGENIKNFKYPTNPCDDKYYFNAVENFNSLFTDEANVYQNRPLFVLGVSGIKKLLNFSSITSDSKEVPILEFLIFQLIILTFSQLLIVKLLENFKKIKKLDIFIISIVTMIFPLFRFEIFKTSNQTFSLLVFMIPLYLAVKKKKITHLDFLIVGILFLFNRSFIITLIFSSLYVFPKTLNDFDNLLKYISKLILFFIPSIFYRLYMHFYNFEKVDINAETYGQFIWLNNYFFKVVNALSLRIVNEPIFEPRYFASNWHCTSIPENFICYLDDTIITFRYLIGGFIIILLLIFFSKVPNLIIKNLFLLTLISYLFWSLIGWYPPVRFNLYTIGMSLTVLAVLQIIFLNSNIQKMLFLIVWSVYFYQIEHWNVFL